MTKNLMPPPSRTERLAELATAFKLPTVAAELGPRLLAAGHDEALETAIEAFEMEAQDRRERRVERLRRASKLPLGKTFSTLDLNRYPRPLAAKIRDLARGEFIDRADNVLAFGLPGVGKSHAACAIGHALVEAGRSVLFIPTYELVQGLLAAKRDLELPRALHKLDAFEVLLLDDIGYVQQNAEEVEVLFTLMSERYERRSLMITSNLVFSDWGQIFKNPMTTAAAIDRVVHHSIILEFPRPSFRAEQALKRTKGTAPEVPSPDDPPSPAET
jgi:DNA replication protein DnaC